MASSSSSPSSPNSTTSTSPLSPLGSNPFTATSSRSNLFSRSSTTPITPTLHSPPPQSPNSSTSQTRLSPSPHRTFSDPSPPLLSTFHANRTNAPRPATTAPKNVMFGQDGKETPNRRHSSEGKTNVYTECGRHGDEWLFGGFSLGGTVKKIWEKKR